MKPHLLLPIVLLLIAGCTGGNTGAAPEFTVQDTEGQTISLKASEGRPFVIMFGAAIGCESCKVYSKNVLKPLAQDTQGSVQLLMLTLVPSETNEDLRELKSDTGATWPFARDTDRVAERYAVRSLTTIVVIDGNHDIVLKEVEPSGSKVREKLGL